MFIITGGGSGIGRALAHALTDRQQNVLVIGRREEALTETAGYSPLISCFVADVSQQAERTRIVNHVAGNEISGLVNNAGMILPICGLDEIEEQEWLKTMATNLNAPLFLSQALRKNNTLRKILNIGSGVAYFPVRGWAAYCASKAALAMLSRSFQLEISNTKTASVMPGIIDTDMQALIRMAEGMDKAQLDFFNNLRAADKMIKAETVALFLSWLLLDCADNEYSAHEWDIYETSHHLHWLLPPHHVHPLE